MSSVHCLGALHKAEVLSGLCNEVAFATVEAKVNASIEANVFYYNIIKINYSNVK